MLNNNEIENEGFKPLKKSATQSTEPTHLPAKPFLMKGMSFNAQTGEKESSQQLWEGSTWEKMSKNKGRVMDRANSFVGRASRGISVDYDSLPEQDGAVIIVDPFSTGALLAAEVRKNGIKCARVLSAWDSPVASLVQEGVSVDFCATIQHNDRLKEQELAIEQTVASIRELPFPIIAVIPGAETGVELADQLSSRLGLRTNGTEQSLARRNKYIMGESVRKAGVRAVKQAFCTNIEQMLVFLDSIDIHQDGKLRCVCKPVQSAGTDDVFLCQSKDEAIAAFNKILGKVNGIGLLNDSVLVQEYLQGKEYVVDKVSRDGLHKLVAIWEYDKRPCNGANFVYFGMRLKPSTTEMAKILVAYADKVLDAVGIVNGPSHMEVMVNTIHDKNGDVRYEPCLVEVGARCHGGEGTWLSFATECVGYNQVNVTLDAYLTGKLFNSIQKDVFPLKKAGREVDLVSRHGGIVRSLPGDEIIRKLPSFRSINWEIKPGDYIPKTIDCFTRPGCVQLVGETEEQADIDLEAIHDIELLGLIDYSVICPKPPMIGAVVIVDPFSTGANMAAQVLKWGYKLILIFSEIDSPVAKLVAKGTNVNPTLLIQHNNRNPDQEAAIQETLDAILQENVPVLAIIPGAEPGVELAEKLSARYGTRNNGEDMTEARRNKYNMQEAIRQKGVRAIVQKLCKSESDVIEFSGHLKRINPHLPYKCVVKPNESAGTDSVFLCSTVEETLAAFHAINGQINGLSQINDGALCQEYLDGIEYVIDGVSRDGIYKVVAIWEYDKRSVNGANFVYFGMKLRDGNDPEMKALIEYAEKVVKALKLYQGPSHMEVKMTSYSEKGKTIYNPCLVEVGARCHGGEGTWITVANECIGYNQAEVVLNCFLRPDRFDELPFVPTLRNHGCEAFLVSYKNGTVVDIPGLDIVRSLNSFRRCEMMTQPGAYLRPTIDCFTRPGSVQMVNNSNEKLEQDYSVIRQLEFDGLFLVD